MALNLAGNRSLRFTITGTMTCQIPYGWIFILLHLEEALQ